MFPFKKKKKEPGLAELLQAKAAEHGQQYSEKDYEKALDSEVFDDEKYLKKHLALEPFQHLENTLKYPKVWAEECVLLYRKRGVELTYGSEGVETLSKHLLSQYGESHLNFARDLDFWITRDRAYGRIASFLGNSLSEILGGETIYTGWIKPNCVPEILFTIAGYSDINLGDIVHEFCTENRNQTLTEHFQFIVSERSID